jgi:hypothetical protein
VRRVLPFVLLGLAVSLALALFVSPWASESPDGLDRVADDQGFADRADEHDLARSPVADYSVDGVDSQRLSTGLAGAVGVVVTFLFALGLFALVRRRRVPGREPEPDHPH